MPPVVIYCNNLHTTVPFFVSWKRKESSTVHFPAICILQNNLLQNNIPA